MRTRTQGAGMLPPLLPSRSLMAHLILWRFLVQHSLSNPTGPSRLIGAVNFNYARAVALQSSKCLVRIRTLRVRSPDSPKAFSFGESNARLNERPILPAVDQSAAAAAHLNFSFLFFFPSADLFSLPAAKVDTAPRASDKRSRGWRRPAASVSAIRPCGWHFRRHSASKHPSSADLGPVRRRAV